jgi:hypothetical protein
MWNWISGTQYLEPGSWYLEPGTSYLVPGTWYLIPITWYLVPGTGIECRYIEVPNTWSLVPGTYYLIPESYYLIPDIHEESISMTCKAGSTEFLFSFLAYGTSPTYHSRQNEPILGSQCNTQTRKLKPYIQYLIMDHQYLIIDHQYLIINHLFSSWIISISS